MIESAIVVVVTALLVGGMLAVPGWFRRHPARRPSAGSAGTRMMGIADELFHPEAKKAAVIVEAQLEHAEPAPTPAPKRPGR